MALVEDLALARRQMVGWPRRFARPRILVLDEATFAFAAADMTKVFVN